MTIKIISKNLLQTQKFAYDMACKIKTGQVFCLYGDLGSGKTTFTQGLASFFGIKKIISPTFILHRYYPIKKNQNKLQTFHHLDLYRLDEAKQVREIGLKEFMDKNNIVIIEWAEKMSELLPKKRFDIFFKYISDTQREITIKEHE